MPAPIKRLWSWTPFVLLISIVALPAILMPIARGQGAEEAAAPSEDSEACLACHGGDDEDAPRVTLASLTRSPHAEQDCQGCHANYTPDYPHTAAMTNSRADCLACHDASAFDASVHVKPDTRPGDHPTCVSCHVPANDPHAIRFALDGHEGMAWTRPEKTRLCADCHADAERMGRYGVDADAVPSYLESFHGKALLRFGKDDAAGCVDCHGAHGILPSEDTASPTNAAHLRATCEACHPGAEMNFAMSGANHMRLKVKASPVLLAQQGFFRFVVAGLIGLLMVGIGLDIRRRAFGTIPPPSGRLSAILVTLSFYALAIVMLLSTFGGPGVLAAWGISIGLLLLAYLARRRTRHTAGGKHYPRVSLGLRLQHALLAGSFIALVVTGLPQRFPQHAWLGGVYGLFGGFDNARLAHRAAGVALITVWVWHLAWLLNRWARCGFSLRSWTMLPNRKDAADAIQLVRWHLGVSPDPPRWDRFTFRAKMDYFAVYWGMPWMALSGLVLWFPVALGNRLPPEALSFAFIAHSHEATLAFLYILTWHMYNSHLNADTFPARNSWITGALSREEMRREHPLELERVESGVKRPEEAAAGGPIGAPERGAPGAAPPAEPARTPEG